MQPQAPGRADARPNVRPGSREAAVLQLQRVAGNAAVAGLCRLGAGGERRAVQRTRGGLKVPDSAKADTTTTTLNRGSEVVGTGAAVAGTYGAANKTGLDTPATYVGNGAALLAGGVMLLRSGAGAAQSFVRIWNAEEPAEQEAAMDQFGDHLLTFKDTANPMIANAGGIAETAQQAAGHTGFVAGAVSHSFGAVAAYGDLAKSMVSWGSNWMAFQGLQEVQVHGWSDPQRAVSAAKSDHETATKLEIQAIQMTSQLGVSEQEITSRLSRVDGYIQQIDRSVEKDARALDMAGRDLDRLKTERRSLEAELSLLAEAKESGTQSIMSLADAATAAHHKVKAVTQFAAQLKARDRTGDPGSRDITLEEIRQYMLEQQVKKLHRDTLRVVGSAIGLAAGLTIVALGWTPIGWGLAAAAGVIGATIIITKAGLWIYRKIKGQRSISEVYAERLWSYAKTGLAGSQTAALGDKAKTSQQATARKLLAVHDDLQWSALHNLPDVEAVRRIRSALRW